MHFLSTQVRGNGSTTASAVSAHALANRATGHNSLAVCGFVLSTVGHKAAKARLATAVGKTTLTILGKRRTGRNNPEMSTHMVHFLCPEIGPFVPLPIVTNPSSHPLICRPVAANQAAKRRFLKAQAAHFKNQSEAVNGVQGCPRPHDLASRIAAQGLVRYTACQTHCKNAATALWVAAFLRGVKRLAGSLARRRGRRATFSHWREVCEESCRLQ